jgi:L-aminopeptidase/D-esterase-like protein
MKGLRVGHFTDEKRGTGASVFLFDSPAPGAYLICGSSPASHELHTLELDANVTHVNALALLGGSAIGVASVAGVTRWLLEKNIGWQTTKGVVPIVPAAAIYDFVVKEVAAPSADEVYAACADARTENTDSGRIGAGTGASVGKVISTAARMSGGIGRAEIKLQDDVSVLAYAVVNSVGDVRDKSGKIIAGARTDAGEFADCEKYLLSGLAEHQPNSSNTTLVAVFTNAKFSKVELKRISKMVVAGIGRAISPAFTRYDGDIVFCFSLGDALASEVVVGAAAAEACQLAIENAVLGAVILGK